MRNIKEYGIEIRVFPNSTILEHETKGDRSKYIEDYLRNRNGSRGIPGQYWLRSLKMTRRISPGTIVLFRFGEQEILGEGMVKSKSVEKYFKDDDGEEYEGYIMFEPKSLLTYKRPIMVEDINGIIKPLNKTLGKANAWTRVPISYHQKILDLQNK